MLFSVLLLKMCIVNLASISSNLALMKGDFYLKA